LIYSRIAGTGRYLPERVLTNAELEKMVDTTDEWIRSRTGIERRHIAADDQATSDLAEAAARSAMSAAGVDSQDIDLIIVGTTTPDLVFPNVATLVQERLGIHGCPAFSLETACSGFVYALDIADKFVRLGEARNALVVRAADAVIAVGGGVGTLSEIGLAPVSGHKAKNRHADKKQDEDEGCGGVHHRGLPGVSLGTSWMGLVFI